MGEATAHLAVSLDGFIADPDDSCDELFGCYDSGDVAVKLGAGIPELPVILGHGIPWLAGTRGPVRLSDPAVIEDRGVTHLRYQVQREG
jgi:hypothetical protein